MICWKGLTWQSQMFRNKAEIATLAIPKKNRMARSQ